MGHISGLNHAAIFVSDIEQLKHFYHDLLGLPIVEYGERTLGIPELSGVPNASTKEYRHGVPAVLGYGDPQATLALTIDFSPMIPLARKALRCKGNTPHRAVPQSSSQKATRVIQFTGCGPPSWSLGNRKL